jgi:predicted alpha-1,2-mannosidase
MQHKNILVICFVSIAFISSSSIAGSKKEPVDYVNTDIGGISILLKATRSVVQWPNDYPQAALVLNPGITDNFVATKIYGFPAGGVTIMPSTGIIKTDPNEIASDFDRDFETRTPYYYKGLLEDYEIEASYTVGHFAVFYNFEYPSTADKYINLMMYGNGWIEADSTGVACGFTAIHNVPYYFYLVFSKPYKLKASWNFKGKPELKTKMEGKKIGITLQFSGADKNPVMIKTGLSFISLDQAKRNLDNAIKGWDFNLRKEETRAAWNKVLGKIEIEGGTEKEKEIFYSSFYRAVQNMMNITEEGHYYSGFDKKVHESNGRDFYTNDQMWDTYRCNHPLQLLLNPKQQGDMIESILQMDEQSGWLPMFPGLSGDFAAMIGQHANEVIADAYFKGCRNFDVEKAYEAMKKEAMTATMLPWKNGPMTSLDSVFLQKGFFPALKEGEKETNPDVAPFERRQAVSVTLEAAYDNWCIARMAKALGHMDDYEYFMKKAHVYKNVFNDSIGFMSPRSADGKWVKEFNPILPSGPGGRDYFAECNSWVWTFNVQHDPAGLIDLFGGREHFLNKLDSLFEVQYGGMWKYSFLAKFPDMTGLIGNYAQGNEPSFHIAYLYDFAGEPWKTQKIVRQNMDVWYNNVPLGLPGDDDKGSLGAWYVFSAMGFYPFCPGEPFYVIGSPVFSKITIHLNNGTNFIINADNVSKQNKYIQSAILNGKPLLKPWFTQKDIGEGGVLTLQMGPRPNKDWGSSPDDAPPSMSRNEK